MKLVRAQFVFQKPKSTKVVTVDFDDEAEVVVVKDGHDTFSVDNKKREYGGTPFKPCVSHCSRVIEVAQRQPVKPTATPLTKRQRKLIQPALSLHLP
jgi:hypothetical protein